MSVSGLQGLDPAAAIAALGFIALSLWIGAVVGMRLWAGPDVQAYPGRTLGQIRADRRVRLVSGLVLVAAWASVLFGLVRHSLRPGIAPLLASHLGPLPIPQWIALVIRDFYWGGLFCVMLATLDWFARVPPPSLQVSGLSNSARAILLSLFAIGMSVIHPA